MQVRRVHSKEFGRMQLWRWQSAIVNKFLRGIAQHDCSSWCGGSNILHCDSRNILSFFSFILDTVFLEALLSWASTVMFDVKILCCLFITLLPPTQKLSGLHLNLVIENCNGLSNGQRKEYVKKFRGREVCGNPCYMAFRERNPDGGMIRSFVRQAVVKCCTQKLLSKKRKKKQCNHGNRDRSTNIQRDIRYVRAFLPDF